MKGFHVQDRARGVILIHGTISPDGEPHADEIERSFDRSQLPTILEAIKDDLQQGCSGGQLPVHGLEWMELSQPG